MPTRYRSKNGTRRDRSTLYYEAWYGGELIDTNVRKDALEKLYGKTADNPNIIYKPRR